MPTGLESVEISNYQNVSVRELMQMCGDVTHFLNIFCSVPTDCVAVRGFVEQEDSFFHDAALRGPIVHAHKSLSKL